MPLQEDFFFLDKSKQYSTAPGNMQDIHFFLLVEISALYSEKVIRALRDFLVDGYTRKEACERNNVALSYFSMALRKIQRTEQAVFQLLPYYVASGEYNEDKLNSGRRV